MFEWLEQEILAVKTPRFHVVDGPANELLEQAIRESTIPLPQGYPEFVLRFGNAKLYRNPQNNSYRIGVFGAPRAAILRDGTHIYHIGFHDGANVYVKPTSKNNKTSFFEFDAGSEKDLGTNFERWLELTCDYIRRSYTDEEWASILEGPKPFTSDELDIIIARRQIHWRVLGIDGQGGHIFEVTNNSDRILPALTIGVRSRDNGLNGAVRLDTHELKPGETAVLHKDCYKGLVPSDQIDIFNPPDPKPEDREYYYEFQG